MAESADGVKPGEGTPASSPDAVKPTDAGTPASTPDTVTPAGGTPPATTPAGGDKGGKPGEGGGEPHMVPYSALRDARATIASLKAEKAARSVVYGAAPAVTPAATPPGNGGGDGGKPSDFVTREELHSERRVDALASEATQVATEHDGTDGYPAFDLDATTEYMKETGIRSYRYAYQLMNHHAIVEAEKAKAVKEALKVNTPQTVTPGGSAFATPPVAGELTREGIGKMPVEEYKKLGGAKGLRSKILGGSVK